MLDIADDRIIIASRTAAARILASPTRRQGILYLISIGTASEPPPAGLRNVSRRLRLLFEDECNPGPFGPTEQDVRLLINFARGVDLSAGRLLVHCQAGISRSAAAAAIVLAAVVGPGAEVAAADLLHRLYPACRPNRLMLQLAGQVLGTGAALTTAWDAVR
jgi:predicted protein tyrosine phosphatase